MTALTMPGFVEEVLRLKVLDDSQSRELQNLLVPSQTDVRLLASELIGRHWLTEFVRDSILSGRSAEIQVDKYVLLEKLGEGGMGVVYKALHTIIRRIDAVKLLNIAGSRHSNSLPRFLREAVSAGKLRHPNIVGIYDAGASANGLYLAMEYVEGLDLARQLEGPSGQMPVARACEFARQAALGLQHAHERGLVHRDIKPSNLIAGKDGVVKVLDLGLALLEDPDHPELRLTTENVVMGTPDYISPEQSHSSRDADERSDIYSLGCTLYHLLAGVPPYPGGTVLQKLLNHQNSDPVPLRSRRPEVSEGLAEVVRNMMARSRSHRYQTAAEAALALAPFCAATVPIVLPEPLPAAGKQVHVATADHLDTVPDGPPMLAPLADDEVSAEETPGVPQHPARDKVQPPSAKPAPASRRRRTLLIAAAGGLAAVMLAVLAISLGFGGKKERQDEKRVEKPTLVVDPQGELKTIGAAVSKANSGMRILIKPGRYVESVSLSKDVELVGEGNRSAVVIESASTPCLAVSSGRVAVRNLTLMGKGGAIGAANTVLISGGQVELEKCVIGNESWSCVAIRGPAGTSARMTDCLVKADAGGAVVVSEKAAAELTGCDLQGRTQPGLEALADAEVACSGCQIHDGAEVGARVTGSAKLSLKECNVYKQGDSGAVAQGKGKLTLTDCHIHDNTNAGIMVSSRTPLVVKGGTLKGNYKGLVCERNAGAEVSDCTFKGNTSAEVRIALEGFAELTDCVMQGGKMGVEVEKKGKGVLTRCKVKGQEIGARVDDVGSELTLDGCEVADQRSNGVVALQGKVTILKGKVSGNQGYGIVCIGASLIDLADCDLRGNKRGAMDLDPVARVTKRNVQE